MKNTEKQLKSIPSIRMTEMERISMRRNLIAFMEIISPSTKIPSPFINFWSPVLLTMASFVFIIFGGSAIAYHASNSLPGDSLYDWKVNVNERVAGIFIKSESEKILYERNLVAKRIDEVKKLADEGTLTMEKVAIAEKKIDTHIAKIDEEAKSLAESNPIEFVKTAEGLQPIIDAHEKDILNIQKEERDEQNTKIENVLPSTDPSVLNPIPTAVQTTEENKKDNTGDVLPIQPTKIENKVPTEKENTEKALENLIQKVQKESTILQNIAEQTIQ
jgi:hypothetical protein